MLTQPQYVILDEATSALDQANEENLYRQLQTQSIAVISVGHRSSLMNYHQQILELNMELNSDRTWQLYSATIKF